MRRNTGVSRKQVRAREYVIQAAIGRMLSAQYDLSEPLPFQLEHLLKRLESSDEISAVANQRAQIP
jgi:hypothetical protein